MAQSSYSQSNSASSQHDPSSPPHFTALPSADATPNSSASFQSGSSTSTTTAPARNPLDTSIDSTMNGQFRTRAPGVPGAFASPFATTFASPPSAGAGSSFNLGPSPNPSQQSQQPSFRSDLPAAFPSHYPASPPTYPTTKADVFGPSQPADALGRYDFDSYPHDPLLAQQHQHLGMKPQGYNNLNMNGAGPFGIPPQPSQIQVPKPQQAQTFGANGGMPYLNGHGPPPPPHGFNQPGPIVNGLGPFGHAQHPMLHAPGPGGGPNQPPGQQQPQAQASQAAQGGRNQNNEEEISTIFVVGFPDDMQEREFQNMFTFSVGFEAATLKIPNKDSSAYAPASGASGARQGGYPGHNAYNGSQDPYNLVTLNSGGVVVDGPQGTSSSWQQGPNDPFNPDGPHSANQAPNPPRKQIIGFAKFRTRQEALEARDILQGRRVDIEKGAVLKAEMAKKNLHTKRGVGPLTLPVGLMGGGGSGGVVGPEMLSGMPGLSNGYPGSALGPGAGPLAGPDPLGARDREMGVIGAMGLSGPGAQPPRRQEEDKDRRPSRIVEEEERRRKEKEQIERNNKLRMSNAAVFDAFHSVPAETARRSSAAVNGGTSAGAAPLSPPTTGFESGTGFPGFQFQNGAFGQNHLHSTFASSSDPFASTSSSTATAATPGGPTSATGPWGKPAHDSQKLPPRPPSAQSSPPSSFDAPYLPPGSTSRSAVFYGGSTSDSSAFSPPDYTTPLPPIGPRARPQSPNGGGMSTSSYQTGGSRSNASSVAGSQSSLEGEFSRTLMLGGSGTHQDMTSPQLPSPGSGGSSSNNTRQGNASDQNPPINTLYVGNLPNTLPTGYPPNYLEEGLKQLFSGCKGYRKLCFRQKSNGPMCFVEFEDVPYATKALNDLYGNTLNGVVKGGIRLSFSKNPLGVRPQAPGSNQSTRREPSAQRTEGGGGGWNPPPTQQTSGLPYSSMHEAFASRSSQQQQATQPGLALDVGAGRPGRLDGSELSPPNTAGFYSTSPPRFFSPPPSQTSFGMAASATSSFPRSSQPNAFGPPGFSGSASASQHSPPFLTDGDERLRYRDPSPHFAPTTGLEAATRVG